jgi:hypothetical protein
LAFNNGQLGVVVIRLINTAKFTGNPPYSIPPYSWRRRLRPAAAGDR